MQTRYMFGKFLSFLSAAILVFGLACSAIAQDRSTEARNALEPPPGAKVALIEFSDLECPACAQENTLLRDAAAKYHIPWIRRDFPIPFHRWSKQAAVNARWLDTKSKKVGDAYRDAVFADQINIETPDDLRAFTEKFTKTHGLALPFVVDPQGNFAAAVQADYTLGERLGVHQTPTVWVVSEQHGVAHAAEVKDFTKLYQMIDEAMSETGSTHQ